MFTTPTVADFKAYFNRDFPYGATDATVMDTDIQKALDEVPLIINTAFFETQAAYNIGFLLLAAHSLVTNLLASAQGVSGQFSFLQSSKGVGSVSESFAIPEVILQNPVMSMLVKTNYGAKYVSIIQPYIIGNVFVVEGGTSA